MKIVKKGFMPDTTAIQIEDWSEDYYFHNEADTIAAYPKSKINLPGGNYKPRQNQGFRLDMTFASKEAAEQAFDDLTHGRKVLSDYVAYMRHPEYAMCL